MKILSKFLLGWLLVLGVLLLLLHPLSILLELHHCNELTFLGLFSFLWVALDLPPKEYSWNHLIPNEKKSIKFENVYVTSSLWETFEVNHWFEYCTLNCLIKPNFFQSSNSKLLIKPKFIVTIPRDVLYYTIRTCIYCI